MKQEQKIKEDSNPRITGSIGGVIGALIGTAIGVALSRQSIREKLREQFDQYKYDGIDAVREIHKKHTEKKSSDKDDKKLLTRAD